MNDIERTLWATAAYLALMVGGFAFWFWVLSLTSWGDL